MWYWEEPSQVEQGERGQGTRQEIPADIAPTKTTVLHQHPRNLQKTAQFPDAW